MNPRIPFYGRAVVAALVCLLMLTVEASAQEEEKSPGVGIAVVAGLSITSTSFVGTTQANLRESKLRKKKDELESLVLIDHYINHYEEDARFAFAMGGGQGLDDLAILMGRQEALSAVERGEVRAQNKRLAQALALTEDHTGRSLNRARAVHAILDPIFFPSNDEVAEVTR
ncbi:MAG: hypothetical protein VYE40_08045 [Myxococcota bacterium]|jgi:hypothetical protein|nr:hypothetical protein [Myxococcota bacterium]